MSYHWANITWQSQDRTWNRGFFKRISNADNPSTWNDPEYGYSSEWDDDFDDSIMVLVGTGFESSEAANEFSGPRGNPGYSNDMKYWGNAKSARALDKIAAKADRIETPRDRRRYGF